MKTVVLALLAIAAPARADEATSAQIVAVPGECGQFWEVRGSFSSPAAWDALLSFASCIQDRRVYRVDGPDELEGLVETLRGGLAPSLRFYQTAIENGPDPIQLRAAYHIGMSQVAMMTRARASLASSDLRVYLEPLLEPHAELAYYIFATIDRAATSDPALTPDVVTQYMVRSSREQARALRHRWSVPPDDDQPRLARPR